MTRKGKPISKVDPGQGRDVETVVDGTTLRIHIPGPEEKGYVGRMKKLGLIQRALNNEDYGVFADLVDFLSTYTEADEGVDVAQVIEEMSLPELQALFKAFGQGVGTPQTNGAR